MANKLLIILVALIVLGAGTLGALVVLSPSPEDNSINASIVSPSSGTTVSGLVNVTANITSGKAISFATLKMDSTLLGNLTVGPFYWALNTVNFNEGQHTLRLDAMNSAGTKASSSATITINNGGTTVAISSPLNSSHVSGNISIGAEVNSPRSIRYVSFQLDGVEVANLTSAPYSVPWDANSSVNGAHEIVVRAVDILNMSGVAIAEVVVDHKFTYVDARGVAITFPSIPQRIIALGNSFTEVIFAVGAGGQMVGRDSKSLYPVEALSVKDVGGITTGFSLVNVMDQQPDCVVTWKFAKSSIDSMEAKGIKVVALSPSSISTVMQEIRDIGTITGHQKEAVLLVTNMTERINKVEQGVPSLPLDQKPKVYFELRSGTTVNASTISGQIIALAGGLNIYWNVSGGSSITPSYPYVIKNMPDVIVVENQSTATNSDIAGRAGWSVIPAVSQGHIYRINGEWMTASPRLVNAIEQMKEWFYPGLS